jgi:ABC-type sulfate/molybdate transport systems ATPase subunit
LGKYKEAMSLLEVRDVSVNATEGKVLSQVSFRQERGEHIVVAGETGSGKSTLLKVIAGLAHADTGDVLFEGSRVVSPLEKLVPGHREIAYLSQQFELPKFLRVEQVLQYANAMGDANAHELYELCQISHLLKRKTDQLSGGERQRIALARLLSGEPKLLLLDEPFSNLDMPHKRTLKAVLDDIVSTLDISFILVSHDPDDTLPWADRILILHSGSIIQLGTATEIYRNPANEYCAGLFGTYVKLPAALLHTFGATANQKYWRPEDFSVSNTGVAAVVQGTRYFGSHFDCDVMIDGHSIVVRTVRQLHSGTEVFITIA